MNYITKDITTVKSPAVIMHGVNCQMRMGSGVAKALYEKWPSVRDEYLTLQPSEVSLGMVQPVKIDKFLWVLNCFTQEHYGYDGRVYASKHAIITCLDKAVSFCEAVGIKNLYSPKIGCGLGGLKWEDLQNWFDGYTETNITICEKEEQ